MIHGGKNRINRLLMTTSGFRRGDFFFVPIFETFSYICGITILDRPSIGQSSVKWFECVIILMSARRTITNGESTIIVIVTIIRRPGSGCTIRRHWMLNVCQLWIKIQFRTSIISVGVQILYISLSKLGIQFNIILFKLFSDTCITLFLSERSNTSPRYSLNSRFIKQHPPWKVYCIHTQD